MSILRSRLLNCMVVFLFFQFPAWCQRMDSIQITGNYKDIPYSSFLSDISRQYEVKIYYKTEWLEHYQLTKSFDHIPLRKALDQIFKDTPYLIQNIQDAVIVLPKEDVAFATGKMEVLTDGKSANHYQLVGDLRNAGKFHQAEISGKVISGRDNSPVIGALIRVPNTNLGAVTDRDGQYTLELPTGILNLNVSSVGFEDVVLPVKLVNSGTLDIQMPEQSIKIKEVIISAKRANHNVSSNQMSLIELDKKQIKQLPSLYGTKDVLKSMTMVAGVKSVGEFGSDINVRGGGGDQNLYLIDGAPVFNTAHIFGLISVLNSDVINGVSLYKGDIPAKFGERISSVMDIEVKKDIPKTYHCYGGIGLIDSRIAIEAPIVAEKLSLLVSGRTTYSDWLLKSMPDLSLHNSSARFYDGSATLSWNIDKNNKFSIFAYTSNDYFKYVNELSYSYGNKLASAQWRHTYGSSLFSVLSYSVSDYRVSKYEIGKTYEKSETRSGLQYHSAKLNFSYTKFKDHTIDFGLQSIFYFLDPGEISPSDTASLVANKRLKSEKANESALYISDKYDVTDKISINAGLRLSQYSYLGASTIYNYRAGQTRASYSVIDSTVYGQNAIVSSFTGLEPRVSVKYLIDETQSVKMNYNRNFQYISLISYTSVFTPDDRWKLSDPYQKPTQCDQIALGYFKNLRKNTIETSVEVYYKKLKNLIEYKNGADLVMNPTIERELMSAEGANYGAELSMKANLGRLDCWVGYTWSRSMRQTTSANTLEQVNQNSQYPSSYDKPHELNLFLNYHFTRRCRVAATFNYSTGRAITLPELKYKLGNDWVVYYSDRNKYRLPDYHRLDLSISFDESLRIKKKWKGSWTLSVVNVYGRANAFSVFYTKEEPSKANDYKQFSLNKLFIIGQPVPTFTYNFIF